MGLIIDPSGYANTNINIISSIEEPNGLWFYNLYIYSTNLYQSKCKYLRIIFGPVKKIVYYESKNEESIVSPKELKPNFITLFEDIEIRIV